MFKQRIYCKATPEAATQDTFYTEGTTSKGYECYLYYDNVIRDVDQVTVKNIYVEIVPKNSSEAASNNKILCEVSRGEQSYGVQTLKSYKDTTNKTMYTAWGDMIFPQMPDVYYYGGSGTFPIFVSLAAMTIDTNDIYDSSHYAGNSIYHNAEARNIFEFPSYYTPKAVITPTIEVGSETSIKCTRGTWDVTCYVYYQIRSKTNATTWGSWSEPVLIDTSIKYIYGLTPGTDYEVRIYAKVNPSDTFTSQIYGCNEYLNNIYYTTWNYPSITGANITTIPAGSIQTLTLDNSHNRRCELFIDFNTILTYQTIKNYYYLSATDDIVTITDISRWTENIPTPTSSTPYLYFAQRALSDDGAVLWTSAATLIRQYEDGKTINSVTNQYGVSSSLTTEPSSWSVSIVQPSGSNKYLWCKATVDYASGTDLDIKNSIDLTLSLGETNTTTFNWQFTNELARTYLGSGNSTRTTLVIPENKYYCLCSENEARWNTSVTLSYNMGYIPSWDANFDIDTAVTYTITDTPTKSLIILNGVYSNNTYLVENKSQFTLSLVLTNAVIPNANSQSDVYYAYKINTGNWINFSSGSTQSVSIDLLNDSTYLDKESIQISLKGIDYKGLETKAVTKNINLLSYFLPSGGLSVWRDGGYSTAAKVIVTPSLCANMSSLGLNNFQSATWYYKEVESSGSFTLGGSLLSTDMNKETSLSGVTFDINTAYIIKITLIDKFGGTGNIENSLLLGQPYLMVDEITSGVGINCIPEQKGLSVDGKMSVTEESLLKKDVTLQDKTIYYYKGTSSNSGNKWRREIVYDSAWGGYGLGFFFLGENEGGNQ